MWKNVGLIIALIVGINLFVIVASIISFKYLKAATPQTMVETEIETEIMTVETGTDQ